MQEWAEAARGSQTKGEWEVAASATAEARAEGRAALAFRRLCVLRAHDEGGAGAGAGKPPSALGHGEAPSVAAAPMALAGAPPAPQLALLRALRAWAGCWRGLDQGTLSFTALDALAPALLLGGGGGAGGAGGGGGGSSVGRSVDGLDALSASAPAALRHVVDALAGRGGSGGAGLSHGLPRFIWPTGTADAAWCADKVRPFFLPFLKCRLMCAQKEVARGRRTSLRGWGRR